MKFEQWWEENIISSSTISERLQAFGPDFVKFVAYRAWKAALSEAVDIVEREMDKSPLQKVAIEVQNLREP